MADKRVEIIDEDGRITIAEEVIASIAQIATEKVDGIALPGSAGTGGLRSLFGGEDIAPQHQDRAIGDRRPCRAPNRRGVRSIQSMKLRRVFSRTCKLTSNNWPA